MGTKLVNCDCRQPGFPRHTHTHPLDADGKMLQGQDKEPGPGIWPFSPAKGKTPKRPFRHWPLVWLLVGLALVALKVWLEWHQKIEVELP